MTPADYLTLKVQIIDLGYAEEVAWAANIQPCVNGDDFATEHAFVVCNSGMKAQIARKIFERIRSAQERGESANIVFGHKGKSAAIDAVRVRRTELFADFSALMDDGARVEWLSTLPWIGGITKWHLAKNLGVNCCKPDRHLVRIAAASEETPKQLCERISREVGDKVAVVDLVIWRAANLRLV